MSSTVCVSASWRSVSRSRRSSILINLILAQVPDPAMQKAPTFRPGLLFNLGNVLLSHTLARAVPSGLKGLTSVFGMGTGGSPSLQSPKSQGPAASFQRPVKHLLENHRPALNIDGPPIFLDRAQ